MDAVHRLNGSRLVLEIGLRYSRLPPEGGLQEDWAVEHTSLESLQGRG